MRYVTVLGVVRHLTVVGLHKTYYDDGGAERHITVVGLDETCYGGGVR